MLLIETSQVQQWDRRGKPHSGTAPAKQAQFKYPDFLLPVQRKEQRTCVAGPLLLVPVTGLEPVRCRQRRILSLVSHDFLHFLPHRSTAESPCNSRVFGLFLYF